MQKRKFTEQAVEPVEEWLPSIALGNLPSQGILAACIDEIAAKAKPGPKIKLAE